MPMTLDCPDASPREPARAVPRWHGLGPESNRLSPDLVRPFTARRSRPALWADGPGKLPLLPPGPSAPPDAQPRPLGLPRRHVPSKIRQRPRPDAATGSASAASVVGADADRQPEPPALPEEFRREAQVELL